MVKLPLRRALATLISIDDGHAFMGIAFTSSPFTDAGRARRVARHEGRPEIDMLRLVMSALGQRLRAASLVFMPLSRERHLAAMALPPMLIHRRQLHNQAMINNHQ